MSLFDKFLGLAANDTDLTTDFFEEENEFEAAAIEGLAAYMEQEDIEEPEEALQEVKTLLSEINIDES